MAIGIKRNQYGGGTELGKYLYKNGVDNVALTGGLTTQYTWNSAPYTKTGSVIVGDSNIAMGVLDQYATYQIIGTTIKLNLTSLNSAIVKYHDTQGAKVCTVDLTQATGEGYFAVAMVRLNTANKTNVYAVLGSQKENIGLNVVASGNTGEINDRTIYIDEIQLT